MNIYKKFGLVFFVLLQACEQNLYLSNLSPGYRVATVPYLSQSNANLVQKHGFWDGCAAANTREFYPTVTRHIARVELDSEYLNDTEYKNAYRVGHSHCHISKEKITNPYFRNWNMIGFKGAAVNFKSD